MRRKQILPVRQKSLRWEAGFRTFLTSRARRRLSFRVARWILTERENGIWRSPVSRELFTLSSLEQEQNFSRPIQSCSVRVTSNFLSFAYLLPFRTVTNVRWNILLSLCDTTTTFAWQEVPETTTYSSFVRKILSSLASVKWCVLLLCPVLSTVRGIDR